MKHISEIIENNQLLAAAAQANLRAGKRKVRRNMSPEDDDPDFEQESDQGLVDDNMETLLPAAIQVTKNTPDTPAPVSAPHTAITASPLDLPAGLFSDGLARRKQNRDLLMEWLRTALVEGTDYGKVHIASKEKCEFAKAGRVNNCNNPYHWSKPSLFKPGAEKITGMLGMTVHYPSIPALETALLSGSEINMVLLRCELHDAQGRVVAEGVGARSLNQDWGDWNKCLKMAEKSAHIDATLRLAGLSEVFTQDLEDRPVVDKDTETPPSKTRVDKSSQPETGVQKSPVSRPPKPVSAAPRSPAPVATPVSDVEIVTADDVDDILQRIAEVGIAEKRVLAWINKVTKGAVTQFEQLNVTQATTLLKRLDLWENEMAQERAAA